MKWKVSVPETFKVSAMVPAIALTLSISKSEFRRLIRAGAVAERCTKDQCYSREEDNPVTMESSLCCNGCLLHVGRNYVRMPVSTKTLTVEEVLSS